MCFMVCSIVCIQILPSGGPCKEEKEVQLLERSHDPSPRSGQGETLLLAVGLCVFWYPVKIDLVGVALLLILDIC